MGREIEVIEAFPHHPEADSFDFRRSWTGIVNACSSQRLVILLTCVFTLALCGAYIKFWPPIFTATVRLYGESAKDLSRTGFYESWAVFRSEQLGNEVEMISAAPVLSEVAKREHLKYDDVYHPFFSQLGYLWTESLPGKTWRRIKEFFFPPDYGPYYPTPEQIEEARTLHDFQAGVKLVPVQDTDVGNLQVSAPSPRVAQIANTIVDVYLEQRRQRHVDEATGSYNALNEELSKAQKELDSLEDRMKAYYAQNKLLLVFEKDKVDIGAAEGLKGQVNDLQAIIAGGEKTLAEVEAQLAKEQRNVVAQTVYVANPVRGTLESALNDQQLRRAQLLLHYRPDAPEVVETDRQIAIVKGQLEAVPPERMSATTQALNSNYQTLIARRDQIQGEIANARASLAVRSQSFQQAQSNLDSIPEKMRVVHDMEREHQALERKYQAIQDKMAVAAVARATALSVPDSIHIVQRASAPDKQSWPNTKLLWAAALAIGIVAGVALALLMDLFFGRLHRYRIVGATGPVEAYAMLRRDPGYAAALFAPEPKSIGSGSRPLRLGKPGNGRQRFNG